VHSLSTQQMLYRYTLSINTNINISPYYFLIFHDVKTRRKEGDYID